MNLMYLLIAFSKSVLRRRIVLTRLTLFQMTLFAKLISPRVVDDQEKTNSSDEAIKTLVFKILCVLYAFSAFCPKFVKTMRGGLVK